MRKHSRDRSQAEVLKLFSPYQQCPAPGCGTDLRIVETRERYVPSLDKGRLLVLKGKQCPSLACPYTSLRHRPPEEGRLVLKGHEFGLDVVVFAGERYLREHTSIPRIHNLLFNAYHVPICERSVGNLIDDYVLLCESVAGDSERLRLRLKQQGAIVLAIDGVHYDDRSPVLYVQRDVLSGEVLYAERRLARATEDLVPMLERTVRLASDIGVPILGIISDKERSLVPAIKRAFPGHPHQFCQQHYLGNLAKPSAEDAQRLEEGARQVVGVLREVERDIERRRAANAQDAAIQKDGSKTALPATAADEEQMRGESKVAGNPEAPGVDQGARNETTAQRPSFSPQETEVARALAKAGTTLGMASGRPTMNPAGLKRYKGLEQVRAAAKEAARKKGGPPDGWPLIQKVLAAFSPLDELHPVARRLERHIQIVRNVAHLLDSQSSAAQVKRALRTYLNRLEKNAPRRGRGAPTGRFIDHVVKVSNSYWRGLFHTYDHPKIPRTTNQLEGFFGSSKNAARRTTGRKSTAGGKLESYGEAIVRVRALLKTMPPDTLALRIADVPPEAYQQAKCRFRELKEPARERRSIQRAPGQYIQRKLATWLDTT